jgi:hypothetical protein
MTAFSAMACTSGPSGYHSDIRIVWMSGFRGV